MRVVYIRIQRFAESVRRRGEGAMKFVAFRRAEVIENFYYEGSQAPDPVVTWSKA